MPHERPQVEILVDGVWYPGELRGVWRRHGRRLCNVSWRPQVGLARLDTVTADRVRLVGSRNARVSAT